MLSEKNCRKRYSININLYKHESTFTEHYLQPIQNTPIVIYNAVQTVFHPRYQTILYDELLNINLSCYLHKSHERSIDTTGSCWRAGWA